MGRPSRLQGLRPPSGGHPTYDLTGTTADREARGVCFTSPARCVCCRNADQWISLGSPISEAADPRCQSDAYRVFNTLLTRRERSDVP